ncbi:FlgD immunoglobulin-like domain containing protein, partial [Rothia sp. P5764]|uniref:FlgD immunoglobulin-like domain containing protein n=1 Tax=Rothia sp. P5764 TaxID=3402654 RepID=UPI003AD1F12C
MTKKTNIAAVLLIAPTMIPFSPSHAVETGTQTNNVALIAPVANAELASTPTPSPAPTGSETPAPAPSPVPTETPTPIPAPSDPPIDDTPVPAPPTFSEEDVTIIQGSNKEFVVSGYQESGVEVTFTLRDSSDSVVEIRNSSGDLVSEITRETNEDGLVKFTLDTSDLPLGVYVLTAAAVDTESATSKIQVQAPPVETPAPPVETPAPPVETPAPPVETPAPPVSTPPPPVETPTPPVATPSPPAHTP